MRGNVEDIVIITIIIVIGAFAIMMSYLVLSNFAADPNIMANAEASGIFSQGLLALDVFGNAILFITIAFGLAAIISAFYTDTHPVFFVFSLMSFSLCMLAVTMFSQFFLDLAATDSLLPVASHFVSMVDTIRNFPILGAVIGALIIIALYAKRGDVRQGGGMA